ncbi:MAG: flagellar hook assembly protein FlgD [Gammaproteobacteria bacterium]|nr:flagellar hook assembly protein FlgD [Gammaproteobacteria bacterium]
MSTSAIGGTGSILDQYKNTVDRDQKKELGKNEFLELLVAQLNNQNPLDPQDNGEFIAQLAQFSSLEGIEKLNTSMGDIISSVHSSQALQAASLVGKNVIIPTDTAVVDTTAGLGGHVLVPQSSSNVLVNVYDESGSLVHTINLGAMETGNHTFSWDGTNSNGDLLPAGKYRFEAEGSFDGKNERLYTMLPARVDSVTMNPAGGSLLLNLAGLGAVPLSEVQIIGQ